MSDSKIERYKKAQAVANRVCGEVLRALGRDLDGSVDSRNDKHSLHIRPGVNCVESWGDRDLWLHASYGYYGSSSGYSATSDDMRKYIARAINKHMPAIAETAMELVKRDADDARLAAQSEANAVLEEVNGE